ncbi:hypothetical protein [Streptomyces sp. NPDC056061]|uniref:hypothetical protein n=1 Tax=Streptomyces sp. NPDC056061 TaxID=3345700 RepID=UPI0035DC3571
MTLITWSRSARLHRYGCVVVVQGQQPRLMHGIVRTARNGRRPFHDVVRGPGARKIAAPAAEHLAIVGGVFEILGGACRQSRIGSGLGRDELDCTAGAPGCASHQCPGSVDPEDVKNAHHSSSGVAVQYLLT